MQRNLLSNGARVHSRDARFSGGRVARRASLAAAAAVTAAALAACGSSSSGSAKGAGSSASGSSSTTSAATTAVANTTKSCSSSATKIQFWGWTPGLSDLATKFNQTHPSICVELSDVGAGAPEYTKLTNAVHAGSGAPDVAQIEYDELPSFTIIKALDPLNAYGVTKYQSDFVPWVWQEVSQNGQVMGMPDDAGPVGLYYNKVLFAKYHLSVPTTWAAYAVDAAKLKKADPSAYIADFDPTDLQWMVALMAQDGAFPFTYSGGKTVGISLDGAKQQPWIKYWENMFAHKYVNSPADVKTPQFDSMDSGQEASGIVSGWFPAYFGPDAVKSKGDWRAATMPQWTPGAHVAADWGGSSYAVLKASKHPAQAAQFVEWLGGTLTSWNKQVLAPTLNFPSYKPELTKPSFLSSVAAPTGTSHPFVAFAKDADGTTAVQWPPFMTEALTLDTNDMAPVAAGKETLGQGLATLQKQLVSYAKAQGFTVTTG